MADIRRRMVGDDIRFATDQRALLGKPTVAPVRTEARTMPFTKTIPILRILDEAKAKEFYVDFLGFKIDWGNRATGALFMQVSLDECVLHLSEHSGDAVPGAAVKLHTDKIDEYVEQLVAKEYPAGVAEQYPGLEEQPWGSLDMVLVDPFGNRLIFTNADCPVIRGSSIYSE